MDKSSDGQYASDEDIFDDEEDRRKSWSFDGSAVLASLEEEFVGDRDRLTRARRILAGVPPPPNFTNPQISLEDALARLRNPTHSLDSLLNRQLDVGNEIVAGHDVYLNRNDYVEELEVLRPELQRWLVSNETSSILMTEPQRPITASAKKRSRTNGWSGSPNSRVNYLHRRKTTFSTLHSTSAPRTVTIDKGKLKKGKIEANVKETKSSLKRALFQSPEKVPPDSNGSLSLDCGVSNASSGSISTTPTRSRRMSWSNFPSNDCKKNTVQEHTSEKKKCWRSLQFSEKDSKEKRKSSKKLSKMHHKKMLWAVDHLLKSEGVKTADAEYRPLCLLLYRETAEVWLRDHENKPRPPGSSTSNTMLSLAHSLLSSVEKKAGVAVADIKSRRRSSDLETNKNSDTYPSSVSSSMDASIFSMRMGSVDSESSTQLNSVIPNDNIETVSLDSFRVNSETLSEASCQAPTPPPSKVKRTPYKTPRKRGTPSKSTLSKNKTPVKSQLKITVKTPNKAPVKSVTPSKAATSVRSFKRTPRRSCRKVNSLTVLEKTPPEGISHDEVTPKYPKRKRNTESDEESPKKSKYSEETDETSIVSTPVSKSTGCDEEITDKENNSAIRNADLDSLNWSPVIRLKRMTRNRWSSELKKKRVSSNGQVKGIEESQNPQKQPFLELEGPFKYRNAGEGALKTSDYIRVLLSGDSYSGAQSRLVKNKDVTTTSILVRSLNSGLELHIPVNLLYQQQSHLGGTGICDIVELVLEDAISRLEEAASESCILLNGFAGFTVDDTSAASWKVHRMNRRMDVFHLTGSPRAKPLFRCYQYALVSTRPSDSCHYYCLNVEIPKTSVFLVKRKVDENTILVHPRKSESSKRIILELSIPITLASANHPPSFISIIQDLNTCQSF